VGCVTCTALCSVGGRRCSVMSPNPTPLLTPGPIPCIVTACLNHLHPPPSTPPMHRSGRGGPGNASALVAAMRAMGQGGPGAFREGAEGCPVTTVEVLITALSHAVGHSTVHGACGVLGSIDCAGCLHCKESYGAVAGWRLKACPYNFTDTTLAAAVKHVYLTISFCPGVGGCGSRVRSRAWGLVWLGVGRGPRVGVEKGGGGQVRTRLLAVKLLAVRWILLITCAALLAHHHYHHHHHHHHHHPRD